MIFRKYFTVFYKKYALYFILGIIILILLDWFQLEIPLILSEIIDMFKDVSDPTNPVTSVDSNEVMERVFHIFLIVCSITVGRFFWRFLLFGTSRKIEFDLRQQMFIHSTKLSNSFYKQEKTGALMTYFTNDLEAVRQVYGMGLLTLVDGLVLGTFVIYRMFQVSAILTWMAVIPLIMIGILMLFVRKRMELRFQARQESFENLSSFTQETFSGIAVVKAYVKEIKEAITFNNKALDLKNKSYRYIRYSVLVNVIITALASLVVITIIALGAYMVLKGNLSPGELTAYTSFFFTLLWPVMALSQFINLNSQAQASSKRIKEFLDSPITVCDDRKVIQEDINLDGSIEIKNLTFSYPDDKNHIVLDHVSFKINNGEMVGILGRTGSGKSSLVDLFLRVNNSPTNTIFVSNYDIMELPIRKVRDIIGYVPQDNFLFSDTIENNIGFGLDDNDSETVVDAAKLSDVYDNIAEFKDGFNTVLGERGVSVSGGQKQRISIARAIAKDPKILILDDSVSAVDTKTEEAIINNLHEVRKNKTTIFIAHRISTVKKMDKIILLENGKVEAVGSHDELLKTCKLYKEMVLLQELEKMVEEGDSNEE